jgi:hypothetical protein
MEPVFIGNLLWSDALIGYTRIIPQIKGIARGENSQGQAISIRKALAPEDQSLVIMNNGRISKLA